MNIHQISHAGEIFKTLVLEHYPQLTISKAAEHLQVTRVALSRVINKKASLSPDLAAKIEQVFGVKSSILLKIQANYDSYYANKAVQKLKLKPYHAA